MWCLLFDTSINYAHDLFFRIGCFSWVTSLKPQSISYPTEFTTVGICMFRHYAYNLISLFTFPLILSYKERFSSAII